MSPIERALAALRACQAEFTTLAPRLTQQYRVNAVACATMAKQAIIDLEHHYGQTRFQPPCCPVHGHPNNCPDDCAHRADFEARR